MEEWNDGILRFQDNKHDDSVSASILVMEGKK
jgi:hypothetical protein